MVTVKKERGRYRRRRTRKLPCDWCGEDFETTRYDTRYCSQKCKQAAYRDRKSVTVPPSGEEREAYSYVATAKP